MGILRSDRVSGLGGANAINGSVFFSTEKQFLSFDGSDIDFHTGDFTVEAWVFHTGGNDDTIISDATGWTFTYGAGGALRFYMATGSNAVDATSSFISNEWVHVAVVRSSGTLTFYQNGTAVGSHSYSHDIANNSGTTYIGKYHSGVVQNFIGNISNLRVVQGTALYTGAFTPPTSRLEKTSDTVLLTCNSASNVLNEETGKSLMNENPGYPRVDQPGPVASRFAPDVGEDHGTTFTDNTKFDTLSYMVPPGGKTTDRYLKSTGDIVSDNLIWHIDAGNTTSYAGVTTSGTTIYDLKAGSGMNGTVGIATLMSGHANFPAPGWTPDNGGAWYLASDTDNVPNNVGQKIDMPYVNLGNDNYTINVWAKLQFYSAQSDGLSYIVSNKDGSPVSYHAHVKEVGGKGRIGAGAYYGGWNYDYAKDVDYNTVIALNQWYMLTWVNTAQYTQSMYVNGVIQKLHNSNTNTWNSRTSNNTPLNSTSYANNETTNAWIGQIQYYSDTLTAAEILHNYNVHKCRYDQ